MRSRILFRVAALFAVIAATLAVSSTSAAQGEGGLVVTECGSGTIEVCGETINYECGWDWHWTSATYFPYRIYAPLYGCDVSTRDMMYRHYARSGAAPVEN